MICSKCGNEIEDGVRFCSVCGSPTGGLSENNQVNPPGECELEVGGFAKLSVADEDNATITVVGTLLKAGLVFKGLSALLFISLFLPFYSIAVHVFGIRTASSINGFRVAFGRGYWSFSGIFLFLIPIVIFALFQFKKEIEKSVVFVKGKLFVITAGLSALGFVLLFTARGSITLPFVSVRPSVGFYTSIVLYLVAAAVSTGFVVAAKKK